MWKAELANSEITKMAKEAILKSHSQMPINSNQPRIPFLQVCIHTRGCKETLPLKIISWLETSSERQESSHSNQTTLSHEFIKSVSKMWQNLGSCHQYCWMSTSWNELKWLLSMNSHFLLFILERGRDKRQKIYFSSPKKMVYQMLSH